MAFQVVIVTSSARYAHLTRSCLHGLFYTALLGMVLISRARTSRIFSDTPLQDPRWARDEFNEGLITNRAGPKDQIVLPLGI